MKRCWRREEVQGPRYIKVTFKYELDSKEGPSCTKLEPVFQSFLFRATWRQSVPGSSQWWCHILRPVSRMLWSPKVPITIIDLSTKYFLKSKIFCRPSGEEVTAEAIKTIIQAVIILFLHFLCFKHLVGCKKEKKIFTPFPP